MAENFTIYNTTGEILYSTEIDCADDTPAATKLGIAILKAVAAGAYLAGANLKGANLAGSDLAGADLTRADLTGANLAEADLKGADLAGANFSVAPKQKNQSRENTNHDKEKANDE